MLSDVVDRVSPLSDGGVCLTACHVTCAWSLTNILSRPPRPHTGQMSIRDSTSSSKSGFAAIPNCRNIIWTRPVSKALASSAGQSVRWDHSFTSCPRRHDVFRDRAQARQRHEGRGRRWLQPYTSCFWCLNPQSICQHAELSDQDTDTCEHPNVVLPLCFGVYESLGGDRWLREHFGREFISVQSYFDWLGEETRFGGDRAIQAVRVAATALRFL